jgi:hypothetical protein
VQYVVELGKVSQDTKCVGVVLVENPIRGLHSLFNPPAY